MYPINESGPWVVIASTLVGIAGGVFPFGYGAIPGGISGLVVGIIWVRIMMRRVATPGRAILGPAIGWGGMMGLLSAVYLHGMIWVVLIANDLQAHEHEGLVLHIASAAAMIGVPIGLVAGLILGAICGQLLKDKIEPGELANDDDADQSGPLQADAEEA